jgi:biotin transport system substrate-specific component
VTAAFYGNNRSNGMNKPNERPLARTVLTALFTALIAAGAYIAIPLGPVPLVMQNFFVILAALLLGPKGATSSVALYLILGALGLPIFAGGTGGFAHFFGPTGGYLLGYLPAAFLGSLMAAKGGRIRLFASAFITAAIVYLIGVPWLRQMTGMTLGRALAVGLYPFIIGDLLKAAAAAIIAQGLKNRIDEILHDV